MALNFSCHIIAESLNFVRFFCYSPQSPLILFTFSNCTISKLSHFTGQISSGAFMNEYVKRYQNRYLQTMVAAHTARANPLCMNYLSISDLPFYSMDAEIP